MALAFDTGKHARAIREGGVPAPAADAIVDAITEATDSLVTEEFLRNELARMEERITARMDMGIEQLRNEMALQFERLQNEQSLQSERLQNDLASQSERLQSELANQTGQLQSELANQTAQLRTEMAEQAGQLRTEMANLRAEMWRAMYLSVGVMAAIAGIALTIAELF